MNSSRGIVSDLLWAIKHVLPMTEKRDFMKFDFDKKTARLGASVFTFRDGDHIIAYIPSLNLSGYGPTKEEAYDMLLVDVADDFFENLLALDQSDIIAELTDSGWTRNSIVDTEFNAPYIDAQELIERLDMPKEKQVTQEYMKLVEKSAA